MRRANFIYPLIVAIAGIAIRLAPNLLYYAWGNDYGIYYYLSQAFLSGKALVYPPNSPWGTDGYQYFPMTYWIVDFTHIVFRIPINASLNYSIPILGGLTPLLLYFISREMKLSEVTSFIAGMLLAVDPIQAYQTSQPNYLTTGHFFLLLSLLFLIRSQRELKPGKYYYLTYLITLFLILSHQLSTYFYIISALGIIILGSFLDEVWKRNLMRNIIYLEVTGALFISYIAIRLPNSINLLDGALLGTGYHGIILAFFGSSLILSILSYNSELNRSKAFLSRVILNMGLIKNYMRDVWIIIFTTFSIVLILSILILFNYMPSFITYSAVIISIPFFIFMSLGIIGIKYALVDRQILLLGWIAPLVGSLIYSLITRNTVLLPARHIEYIVEPMSILAAYVIFNWLMQIREHKLESGDKSYKIPIASSMKSGKKYLAENILVISVVLLVLVLGIMSYVIPSNFVPSHSEAITFQDDAVIQYLNITGNRSFSVATDHQIGILLASYGFVSPFNNLSLFWNSTNWTLAIAQITGENGSYPPIGYVILDTNMIQYGVWGYNGSNNPNQPAISLNNSSLSKFFHQPFILQYENSSLTSNYTSYLFELNWTYINNYLMSRGMGNLSYYMSLYEMKNKDSPQPTFSHFSSFWTDDNVEPLLISSRILFSLSITSMALFAISSASSSGITTTPE